MNTQSNPLLNILYIVNRKSDLAKWSLFYFLRWLFSSCVCCETSCAWNTECWGSELEFSTFIFKLEKLKNELNMYYAYIMNNRKWELPPDGLSFTCWFGRLKYSCLIFTCIALSPSDLGGMALFLIFPISAIWIIIFICLTRQCEN